MSNEPKDIFMLCESIQDEKVLSQLDRVRYKANIKNDGERAIAVKKDEDLILFNRRGNIINYKFNEVVRALKLIDKDFMIDGEIINIDNTIGGNFNLLSRRALTKDKNKIAQLEKEIPVKFMVFDIIMYDKKSVKNEPLYERLKYLRELLKDNLNENLELVIYDEIDNLLALVIENNGEGIVIKDMNGLYESKRSKNWYKHKLFKETTITITGFTENNAGIRATDNIGNAVQISGRHITDVKAVMESKGYANIFVQYLEKTKENKLRFISYKRLENE